jgi:hypothetical protein
MLLRQQYGIIRIYSRTDKRYNQFQDWCFKIFVQCSMIYPIIWWHGQDRLSRFFGKASLLKYHISIISLIFSWSFMALGFVVYLFYEIKMTKENKFFNIPKNLMVIGTVLGWHYGIMYSQYAVFILFNILFTHNLSYFCSHLDHFKKRCQTSKISPYKKVLKVYSNMQQYLDSFTFFFIVKWLQYSLSRYY